LLVTRQIVDAKAKAAGKARIEADKGEPAEKTAREKALRQGLRPPQMQNAPANPWPSVADARMQVSVYIVKVIFQKTHCLRVNDRSEWLVAGSLISQHYLVTQVRSNPL
jgi:hypothetical protein